MTKKKLSYILPGVKMTEKQWAEAIEKEYRLQLSERIAQKWWQHIKTGGTICLVVSHK